MRDPIYVFKDGVRTIKSTRYVDNGLDLELTEVSVDSRWLSDQITRQVLTLLDESAADGTMFRVFADKLVRRIKTSIAQDVGDMGANGRLGMNSEQVELLCAAIRGDHHEAVARLRGNALGVDLGDDLADPIGGVHTVNKLGGIP